VNYKDVRTLPVSSSKERISQYYNVDSTNGKQGVRFQSHSLRASPKARGSLEDVFPGLDIKKVTIVHVFIAMTRITTF
jgi:hypothetical protein